jgi:hypothetical protein
LFNRAKVIAIPKSGKDGSDPVMYKLLEWLILQRIQPLIESATPVHQAAFRKHRSWAKQMMVLTAHIKAGFHIN